MSQKNDVFERLIKDAEKARLEKEAHTMMLEMLADIAPASKRPIFSLPIKVSRVTTKIGDLMMLETQVEDGVGYAVKACEFLDRVEEACEAFMEQAQTAGE